jgi:NADH dehydrogenase
VAHIVRFKFNGFLAWLAWLFIHLMYLVEFENRVLVFIQWAWSYITMDRSARLIVGSDAAGALTAAGTPRTTCSPDHQTSDPGRRR